MSGNWQGGTQAMHLHYVGYKYEGSWVPFPSRIDFAVAADPGNDR